VPLRVQLGNKLAVATAGLIALLLAELTAGIIIAWIGWEWRSPMVAGRRSEVLVALFGVVACASLVSVCRLRRATIWPTFQRSVAVCLAGLASVGLGAAVSTEVAYSNVKSHVLEDDAAANLAGIGPHIIIGYQREPELAKLIALRAVAGVFITGRNLRGRSTAKVAAEIKSWQDKRRGLGLPPLLIAADQEGGQVSRLSPPLKLRKSLAATVVGSASPAQRIERAREYGRAQGADLNFQLRNRSDAHTRIFKRAISADPTIVTAVASAYCEGLATAGITCTLKHFPGLGRVTTDTHIAKARLSTPPAQLETTDLAPFRAMSANGARVMMLSHVHFDAIDPLAPVSRSAKVVDGFLRTTWGYNGALITDDLTMKAAYMGMPRRGLWSVGDAAVASLNAGSDLVLISYDTDQVYPVLQALADAYGNGTLGRDRLALSDGRIATLMTQMGLGGFSSRDLAKQSNP
jgi:beta-N-acetylhexosaminidase